jgi:Calpain family cysteine protease
MKTQVAMKPAGLPTSNVGGRANMYIEQPKP